MESKMNFLEPFSISMKVFVFETLWHTVQKVYTAPGSSTTTFLVRTGEVAWEATEAEWSVRLQVASGTASGTKQLANLSYKFARYANHLRRKQAKEQLKR